MSKKNYKYCKKQIVCPYCKQKYPSNLDYRCPHCGTKFYDLSFIDFNVGDDFPIFVKIKCNSYDDKNDSFITQAVNGISLKTELDCGFLDYGFNDIRNKYGEVVSQYPKKASLSTTIEMEALSISNHESDSPVLFWVEAQPKNK